MNTPRKGWTWAKRALTAVFFVLVPVMLFLLIRNLDWQEVGRALQGYKTTTLLLAGLIALASYLVFSSYDLLGRRYTGHSLPTRQVLPLAFVCYAFNLNLSSWVGGIALRYRLYGKLGLSVATITRIMSLGLVTNWLGYLFVGGAVFAMGLPALPDSVKIGALGLRLIGVAMLLVALAYVLACAFAKKRSWQLRGHEITLPRARFALLQAGLAALNWSLMALVIYTLLPDKVGYPTILAVLLISSIAGVITHIPAGLGVLETIFITLLQGSYSKGTLLAALIGYRALYFLLPLLVACVMYLVLERLAKRKALAQPVYPR
ncbi:MAG: lysylphosphatidylglycerol synthase domain-containing protein [Pseudomonas sp.]|nr:lysylphosphatidylglycerol synthase domain-containing protein [Pseudomonas sp.]